MINLRRKWESTSVKRPETIAKPVAKPIDLETIKLLDKNPRENMDYFLYEMCENDGWIHFTNGNVLPALPRNTRFLRLEQLGNHWFECDVQCLQLWLEPEPCPDDPKKVRYPRAIFTGAGINARVAALEAAQKAYDFITQKREDLP